MEHLFENMIVTKIHSCLSIPTPANAVRPMTARQCSGFLFSSKGKILYQNESVSTFTDPDHFIFIPKGASYCLKGEVDDVAPCVNFDCEPCPDTIVQIPVPNRTVVDEAIHLSELYSMKLPYYETYIRGGIYRIISAVCRMLETTRLPKHLAASVAYILANLSDPSLTNERIAAAANISEVYLSKEFMKYLHVSPHRYLMNQRLERAKYLLATENMSITETAALVGFNSVYHFSRSFKMSTGVSPKRYRP